MVLRVKQLVQVVILKIRLFLIILMDIVQNVIKIVRNAQNMDHLFVLSVLMLGI